MPAGLHADDLALVRAVAAGEPAALADFVERMRCVPAILASQNGRLGSPLGEEDLADVVQETLTVVWRKLDDFCGRSALETWVYRFCFLELMTGIRRRKKRPEPIPEGLERRGLAPATAADFELLHRGLARVGSPWADVIRLKHFGDLTFDEIGRRLSMPANTAKTQYYRGLERLREALVALGDAR